ncbi:MAG: serine/threonine protein kinase [bacterium]|nr:serine/threonine protein kinase [bacterium]
MSTISENAKAIFLEAVEKRSPKDWPEFLDQACGDDRTLRGHVEGLLHAHRERDSLFDEPQSTRDYVPLVRPGQSIGPYKIREQIGDGGMGVVYVAEQEQPLRRKVALKVIKAGMDSKAVIARFEAERNALAMMNHPNIAKVLDAGTTEQGRPFFVMELIQGKPITEYCDHKKLTIQQRLELFTQICNAVQHAHQKGVIHRDIKPSNILVTEIDGKPVPKVIDFGVAKALGANLTDRTVYTSFQSLVGTPLYMSPEQAQLSGVDVDTSSDVYSLGILLYELLTGTTPLSADELKAAAQDEVLRRIRETEPPRPSNRISSLGETSSQVSECRGAQPEQLGRLVRGDLDWIVMKALEKDRSRRYKTADALAADIGRHLTSEPVEARPPSTVYRIQKFVRRNRSGVSFVVVMSFVLLASTFIAGLGWIRAARNERKLQDALGEWRHELIDRGLEAAFRGDLDAVEQITKKARKADASKDWCLLLEGLAHGLGDNQTQASHLLAQAIKVNPDNPATVATFLSMGNLDDAGWTQTEFEEAAQSLGTAKSPGEYRSYEQLLLGWGQMYLDPEKSMLMTRAAIEFHPRPWPIAEVLLAHAEGHVALDRGDLKLANQAVARAFDASEILYANSFAKAILAFTQMVAWQLAIDQKPQEAQEYLQNCANSVEELGEYQDAFSVPAILAIFYELSGDERADRLMELKFKTQKDYGVAGSIGYFFRDDANQKLTSENPKQMPIASAATFAMMASQGEEDLALRGYQSIIAAHPETGFVLATAMQIPFLAGRDDIATRDATAFLETVDIPDFPFYLARTRLEYYAQKIDEDTLMARVGRSRIGQSLAHYAIAMRKLQKDPDAAKKHLRQSIESRQFFLPEYYMAQALLRHYPPLRETE